MTTRIKVMIVEDEPLIARQLECCVAANRWLELAGVAGTREAAIDMARRVRPDLVLLDFGLQGAAEGGFGVWDALHHLAGAGAAADVIAVTGAKETSTVARAKSYGAFSYVVKPFTSAIVNAKLADYAADYRRCAGLRDRLRDRPSQPGLDSFFDKPSPRPVPMPPGVVPETLDSFKEALQAAESPLRAIDIAARVGVSRETANRYLTYLCDMGFAERSLEYGRAGHPAYLYTVASTWTAPDNRENAAQHRPDPDHPRRQPRPAAGAP